MFTLPPMATRDTSMVREADERANTELQSRFPGWTYVNGQYKSNGDPYKAHIRDRDGRVWTVWFGSNDQVTQIVQGDQ